MQSELDPRDTGANPHWVRGSMGSRPRDAARATEVSAKIERLKLGVLVSPDEGPVDPENHRRMDNLGLKKTSGDPKTTVQLRSHKNHFPKSGGETSL